MSIERFFFVRHGETDANANSLMAGGGWDIPLNRIGEAQSLVATEILLRTVPHLDHIFVSSMQRARQTSAAISEEYPKARVHDVPGLIEWKFGAWEKTPWEDVRADFLDNQDPPQGETRVEFQQRIHAGLEACLSHPGEKLIVAHGGVWWYIMKIIGLEPFLVENCTPYVAEKRLGRWVTKPL